ncbi:MAG: hypothetical protein WAU45_19440 [Blastocatellia bacterium]
MPTHKVRLKRREEIAEGTAAFYFEKPEGFQFKAGQFLRFTLIDPPETDAEGDSRTFSIASAPHEEDLMIATRMRDTAFKRVIKSMPFIDDLKSPIYYVAGPEGLVTAMRKRLGETGVSDADIRAEEFSGY